MIYEKRMREKELVQKKTFQKKMMVKACGVERKSRDIVIDFY